MKTTYITWVGFYIENFLNYYYKYRIIIFNCVSLKSKWDEVIQNNFSTFMRINKRKEQMVNV